MSGEEAQCDGKFFSGALRAFLLNIAECNVFVVFHIHKFH
jgi:hypothetical protein